MVNSKKLLKFWKKILNFIQVFQIASSKILLIFVSKNSHILASNEGSAVSIGIGYYLANKKYHVFICKILV